MTILNACKQLPIVDLSTVDKHWSIWFGSSSSKSKSSAHSIFFGFLFIFFVTHVNISPSLNCQNQNLHVQSDETWSLFIFPSLKFTLRTLCIYNLWCKITKYVQVVRQLESVMTLTTQKILIQCIHKILQQYYLSYEHLIKVRS